MGLQYFFKYKKFRFVIFGLFNVFISNLILQILLVYSSSIKATFFSQLVNFFLGYYLYGKKVFKKKYMGFSNFTKYFFLIILLWNTNWIFIEFFHSFGISKNIVALVIVPFLALISYLSQKYIVFRS
tara:strand:+ start:1937 stop:2317 length:381 start_codon:yes stop_codon:yes gene_type:complete